MTPSTQRTMSTQVLSTEQPSPWEHPGSKWLCPLEAPLDPVFPPCTDGEPRPWFPTHWLQSLVSTRLSHVHTCLPHRGQLGGPSGLAGVTCHV